MKYELFYLVGNSKEMELDKIKKEVKEIVTANGGVFEEKETQEKRKLSYEIKHETHGTYIAQRFEMTEKENVQEIISKLNLYQGVLRFVISRADELPELRSKEERIDQAQAAQMRQEKSAEVEEEKKEQIEDKNIQPEEKVAVAEDKKEEKEKTTEEDIDKKLEEILNI